MLAAFFSISLLSVATVSASPLFTGRNVLANVIATCNQLNTVALTFDDGPYQWMDVRFSFFFVFFDLMLRPLVEN
jgi:hypothetical protein